MKFLTTTLDNTSTKLSISYSLAADSSVSLFLLNVSEVSKKKKERYFMKRELSLVLNC